MLFFIVFCSFLLVCFLCGLFCAYYLCGFLFLKKLKNIPIFHLSQIQGNLLSDDLISFYLYTYIHLRQRCQSYISENRNNKCKMICQVGYHCLDPASCDRFKLKPSEALSPFVLTNNTNTRSTINKELAVNRSDRLLTYM